MPTTLEPPPPVKPATPPASETSDASGLGFGWDSQVVLFNDDVNTFQHVAACLMEVFGHPRGLAESIMMEAHWRGRAIAEVEARKPRPRAQGDSRIDRRDPLMDWLLDDGDPRFPPARLAAPDSSGLLAVGGDYSVPRLVEAYSHGIFPWSVYRGRISWSASARRSCPATTTSRASPTPSATPSPSTGRRSPAGERPARANYG